MKHVVALFSEPSNADKAIKKLADAGLDTEKARVHSEQTITSSRNIRPMPAANTAVSAGANPGTTVGGGTGAAPGAVLTDDTIESYLDSIGIDGNEIAFYKHGIRDGGHIVLLSVENSDAEKARSVLADAGGRAPQVE